MTRWFRQKPVEVEALQWDGDNIAEVRAFTGDAQRLGTEIFIWTGDRRLKVGVGDWIVRDGAEFFPLSPRALEWAYEEVGRDGPEVEEDQGA